MVPLRRFLVPYMCLLFFIDARAGEPTSEYSSTKTGKLLKQSTDKDEIDFFEVRCKGYGGYELMFEGEDARSWLNIKYGTIVVDLMNATFALSPGHFPNKANDVVEWRGLNVKGQFMPYAIIYRLNGQDDKNPEQLKSCLIVIKLDKENSAVVGYTEGKNEDADAKRLADQYITK